MGTTTETAVDRARQMGEDHGRAVGSWAIDGNTTDATAQRGFRWNDSPSAPHSWSTYLDRDEFVQVLSDIAALGVEIVAKNARSVVPGFDVVKGGA